MNRTQKVATLFLLSALVGAVTSAYVGSVIVLRRMPPKPLGQIAVAGIALVALAFLALTVFFLVKRQSRAEPESDERDSIIRGKAAMVSLCGSWLLLAIVLLALGLALGQTGSVPVYLLTVILWGVAQITLAVYGVTALVQYGRGGDNA